MKSPLVQTNRFVAGIILLAVLALSAGVVHAQTGAPEPVWVRTTNFSARYITNVISVTVPTNIFYDEYRTNLVRQKLTNMVNVFRTNLMTEFQTNVVKIDDIRTNHVFAYQTNLKVLTMTNWQTVLQMRTNTVTVPVTNIVDLTNTVYARQTRTNFITAYQTNVVAAYQTNLKTLTFTNWQTVLVMKTNWVNTPITNTVEIDLASSQAASAPAARISEPASSAPTTAASKTVKSEPLTATTPAPAPTPASSAVDLSQSMQFELTHAGTAPKGDRYPIKLILKSPGTAAAQPVQEWRVEKTTGGAFLVGSRPEFVAELPAGTYRIVARVRSSEGSLRSIRGEIDVKADGFTQHSLASASPGTR